MNLSHYPVLAPRHATPQWKSHLASERAQRIVPSAPLPAGERPAEPLPDPSDWTFELIERYHAAIAAAAERSEERRVGKEGRSRWSAHH